jgi:hypothetical protein
MTRRATMVFAVVAAGLLLVAGLLHRASRPQPLTALLLDRIGAPLGLEITADGASEYTLRGDPRLVVRSLVVRQPGTAAPILRAGRAALSLPWSTIRARGAVLEAIRLELDDPHLDLSALRRWQATRPPTGAARIPSLTKGLAVRRGRLTGTGWSIDALGIDVPALHPHRPVHADVEGRVRTGRVRVPFDLALSIASPAATAAIDARGTAELVTGNWRLPMRLQASARLRLDAEPARIDALRLGADAQYVAVDTHVPFVLGVAGSLRFAEGATLAPAGIALRGTGAIPTLDANGRIAWRDGLALELDGTLARWPRTWPALPEPLGRPGTPLPFDLAYRGAPDLSGPASLQLRHRAASVDARFRLTDVLAWFDAADTGSALPPVEARVQAPRLEVAGATLEGVEIELDDDGAAPGTREAAAR